MIGENKRPPGELGRAEGAVKSGRLSRAMLSAAERRRAAWSPESKTSGIGGLPIARTGGALIFHKITRETKPGVFSVATQTTNRRSLALD